MSSLPTSASSAAPAPGVGALRPPGSAPAAVSVRGLPAQLTTLVGREREIATVRALLAGTRLLTLTGAGGSGKTRLAIEVLEREAREAASEGAWVELANVRDPALVADSALAALGVRDQSDALSPAARLVAAIGARPLLLALDNCEHLVDACATLTDTLLRACPALRVIATSREVLGVTSETAWLVPPLSLPAGDGDALETSEAVQLFVERARAVKPSFALTAENRGAVIEICRRLDGLPLALELAAARLRTLAPEQIAARLDDRFRLLTTGNRSALPRHQTLRAAIDWSYELLEDRERLLLARLAVFDGGFTLEAAEQVCGGGALAPDEVLDLLSELVEKSLVQMSDAGDSARYRLLETVRQYALERLAAHRETEDVRRRHAAFFLALAELAEPELATERRPLWVARLHAEADNLRQALASSREGDEELHVKLVGLLFWYWFAIGHWPEARQWFHSALTVAAGERPTRDRARVLFAAGAIASLQSRSESAQVHLVEAEALAEQAGDARLLAYARNYRAMALSSTGAAETEVPLLLAREWFREHGDLYGLRLNFLLEASAKLMRGDAAGAVAPAEEGVRAARVFGLDRELAMALQVLGLAVVRQGDAARATALFRESLECARRDPQPLFLARALELVAASLMRHGAVETAARVYGAAAAHRRTIGAKRWPLDEAEHAPHLASARAALGDAAFDAALARGGAMPIGEAIDFALAEVDRCATPKVPEPTTDTSEYEVVVAAAPAAGDRAARATLTVRSLGALEISLDGRAMSRAALGYAKVRELLVHLATWPQGRTRDQITAALWREGSTARVRNNFHVTLHHLRRALGGAERVVFDRERYRLAFPGGIELDALAFEERVTDALRAARRGAASIEALTSAAALYRGHFLEGEPAGDWQHELRERLALLHADALNVLGRALMKAERYEEAASIFERLVQQEELDEHASRALMTCRARLGDRAGAIREYRRLEALLRRELASEPEEETVALFRELQHD